MPVISFAPGVMPGADPLESARRLESELPPPHHPALSELPSRGHPAGLLGRAMASLPQLHTELASYGWRLASGAGADRRRALTTLRADVDALADVRGERLDSGAVDGPAPLTLHVLGPVTLCARLALPNGEKVLIDHGARRDVSQALAAGTAELVQRLRRTVAPSALRTVVLEPAYQQVRAGEVPTVSGYRRIRSLPRDEVRAMLGMVFEAVREVAPEEGGLDEDRDELLVDLGCAIEAEHAEDLFARREARADGFVLPATTMGPRQWERAAALIEGGARHGVAVLGARDLDAVRIHGTLPTVSTLADQILRPWRAVGMPSSALSELSLTAVGAAGDPSGGLLRERLAHLSPATVLRAVTCVRDAAEALEDQSRDDT